MAKPLSVAKRTERYRAIADDSSSEDDSDMPPTVATNRLATFKAVLQERNISPNTSIKIMLTGRAGRGKSTLINNIIEEEVATVGHDYDPGTSDVQTFVYTVNGTEVALVDTPGLGHARHSSKSFFDNLVEDMMRYGNDTSLVFYCMKMTDVRPDDDEVKTIRQLYQAFGREFWERVIIVFTFANTETSHKIRKAKGVCPPDPPVRSQEWKNIKNDRFTALLKKKHNQLISDLIEMIPMPADVAGKIRIIPVGDSEEREDCLEPFRLPDRDNWLYDLLDLCCTQTECLTLSKLHLEDNLHLAVVIDNEYDDSEDDKTPRVESSRVSLIKEALDGFMVLSFKDVNLELMETLVDAITTGINSKELAAFLFIVLGKKKACDEFKIDNILSKVAPKFAPRVPKIFLTHFIMTKQKPPSNSPPKIPQNTVLCTVFCEGNDPEDKFAEIFKKSFVDKIVFHDPNCFKDMKAEINRIDKWSCEVFTTSVSVLPSLYVPHVSKTKLAFKKKKVDIQRKIWRIIRSNTVDELIDIKDEIRTMIRAEHIFRLITTITGVVVGGGLVIGGIAAAPFTFGASIGLSVAGGVVGAAAGAGGIGAMITDKFFKNGRLKKAQEHVVFDQQCSENVNKVVAEYYQEIQDRLPELTPSSSVLPDVKQVSDVSTTIAGTATRVGAVTAFSIAEGAVEGGALALRAGGRVAGMALAGVSLAVTVPIDLGFIFYHSYKIHKSRGDESGEKEDDLKALIETIKSLYIDTIKLEKLDHIVESRSDRKATDGFAIQLNIPDYTISIYTIFCGPFTLPDEDPYSLADNNTKYTYILASAVYRVFIAAESNREVYLNLDHCIAKDSWKKNTRFAIGTLDIIQKKCVFTLLPPDRGIIKNDCGEITIGENRLVCIVYEKPSQSQENTPFQYAAHYSCTVDMMNTWNIKIVLTKNLQAHLKFVKREFPVNASLFKTLPFKFKSTPSVMQLETNQFSSTSRSRRGWTIKLQTNNPGPEPPTPEVLVITKQKELDIIETKVQLSDSPSKAIPSIDLCVQASDDATDNLDCKIKFKGTDLEIPIKLTKEGPRDTA